MQFTRLYVPLSGGGTRRRMTPLQRYKRSSPDSIMRMRIGHKLAHSKSEIQFIHTHTWARPVFPARMKAAAVNIFCCAPLSPHGGNSRQQQQPSCMTTTTERFLCFDFSKLFKGKMFLTLTQSYKQISHFTTKLGYLQNPRVCSHDRRV